MAWCLSWHTGSSEGRQTAWGNHSIHRKIAGKSEFLLFLLSKKMVKNRFDPPFLAMMQNDDDFRSNKKDPFVLYTVASMM